jgi:hypothetical protein
MRDIMKEIDLRVAAYESLDAEQARRLYAAYVNRGIKAERYLLALKEIIALPCCENAKYPGCKPCGAIDIINHRDLEKVVSGQDSEVSNGK